MRPLIVLPAAGTSSRMRGGDKLLAPVGGLPLLKRQALAALAAGCPVAVTLPPGASPRRDALLGVPVHLEDVPDASEGMAASLRRATGLLAEDQALALLLPDVPGVGSGEISAVLEAFGAAGGDRVIRATDPDGRPGTPLILPFRVALRFAHLTGDEGGRAALTGEDILLLSFDDDRATRDLDTPEDWAAWRAETGHTA